MKKLLLISLLVLVALALSGCTQNLSVCGDGVCSMDESNPDLESFCVSDCSKEINAKGGEGLNKENCTYNGIPYCTVMKIDCCDGKCYRDEEEGCCDGKVIYNLATEGCCNGEKYNLAKEDCCYTTKSGGKGEKYTKSKQCCMETTKGDIALFNKDTWKPSTNTVCQGDKFCQTNDCLQKRTATGTNPSLCCNGGGADYSATFTSSTNYLKLENCYAGKVDQALILVNKGKAQNNKVQEICTKLGNNCIFTPGSCTPTWTTDCSRGLSGVVSLVGNCTIQPTCDHKQAKQCR